MIYVLTHEYLDKSAFHICGVAENRDVADAWANANNDNNVYPISTVNQTKNWMTGFDSWKKAINENLKENK